MRLVVSCGVAVLAAGLSGLALDHLVLASLREAIDAGEALAGNDRSLPASTIVGAAAVVAGLAMMVLGGIINDAGGAD